MTVAVSAGSLAAGVTVAVIWPVLTTLKLERVRVPLGKLMSKAEGEHPLGLVLEKNPLPLMVIFVACPTTQLAGWMELMVGVVGTAQGVISTPVGPEYAVLTYVLVLELSQVSDQVSATLEAPAATDTLKVSSVALTQVRGAVTVTFGSSVQKLPSPAFASVMMYIVPTRFFVVPESGTRYPCGSVRTTL
jgi:hypothetical protein